MNIFLRLKNIFFKSKTNTRTSPSGIPNLRYPVRMEKRTPKLEFTGITEKFTLCIRGWTFGVAAIAASVIRTARSQIITNDDEIFDSPT